MLKHAATTVYMVRSSLMEVHKQRIVKRCGGTGQAQTTVAYVSRAREQGSLTWAFWITAPREEIIIARFVKLAKLLPFVSLPGEEAKQNWRTFGEAITYWQEHGPQCWVVLSEHANENDPSQGSLFLFSSVGDVDSLVVSIEGENTGFVEGIRLLLQKGERKEP